jgi:hypothetical protein
MAEVNPSQKGKNNPGIMAALQQSEEDPGNTGVTYNPIALLAIGFGI